jgi:hypothetical protein
MLNSRNAPAGVGSSATEEVRWSPPGQLASNVRLAAILAADVAGYSRLIEADEEGTIGRLEAPSPPS